MRNALFVGLVLLVGAGLLSGCSSAPPPTNTPVIPPAPTTVSLGISLLPSGALPPTPVLPTVAPTATTAPPTVPPTVAPTTAVPPTEPSTATVVATAKPAAGTPTKATNQTVANTKTPTPVPPTRAPSATPLPIASPTVAAGTFVTNLRISPDPPLRGQDLSFYVTFQTDVPTEFRAVVYIYSFDSPNKATGQTDEKWRVMIPAGTTELQALGTWQLRLGGGCENFFARVSYIDEENKKHTLTRPDGSAFEPPITICPPQ